MPSLLRAYANKIRKRLTGAAFVPARGRERGRVLLSYMTGPFARAPWERFTDPHTSYWECAEIARLLSERGYAVDAIDARDARFVPRYPYAACIDTNANLGRFKEILPLSCRTAFHITFAEASFQNRAERQRLDALFARRGVRIAPSRQEPLGRSIEVADLLEGFGNTTILGTYASFGKPIFSIPISVAAEYPLPERDFASARKRFMWFGGGGAVLKGLDLVLEAFAELPEYELIVVGPAAYEPEFAEAYAHELSLPHIRRYPRPHIERDGALACDGVPFIELAREASAIVYPTASDGTSGSIVQAMHTGLIPLVTRESGMLDDAPATWIEPSIDAIRAAVHAIAGSDPAVLTARSRATWEFAQAHHTKAAFSEAYGRFIDTQLLP